MLQLLVTFQTTTGAAPPFLSGEEKEKGSFAEAMLASRISVTGNTANIYLILPNTNSSGKNILEQEFRYFCRE
jgi:hypothetical protein